LIFYLVTCCILKRVFVLFAQEYIHQNIWDAVVWGCISIRGPGVCAIVEERLRAPIYVRILREIMLPSVTHVFGERNFIFQDDNCRVHRARAVREFLDEQEVRTLPWPSKSPDINPIENIWGLNYV
jgi:hypothetical protein